MIPLVKGEKVFGIPIQQIFSIKMFITLAMGFSAGLPLLLTLSAMQAWMSEEGINLGEIGLVALVGLPYSWKFLWAPVLDRFALPFLGRRRGWLLLTQILLALSISGIGFCNPSVGLTPLMVMAALTAFFSATQDMVVDAYRREHLEESELALGSTFYTYGYRIGMVVAGSGTLIVADIWSWRAAFVLMGLCMGVGIMTTLFAPEPQETRTPPRSLKESVWGPFREFFHRDGAWLILSFVLLYKLGDTMASAITIPFYLEMGFTKTEIGVVAKGAGLAATLLGMGLGGALVLRLGTWRSLWVFGILQGVSTAGFSLMAWYTAHYGVSTTVLSGVIGFENLAAGMGTAAYMAYMAFQTDKRFTATQYALLTSLMSVPRTVLSSPSGFIVEAMGWIPFFLLCALVAVPGLVILGWLGRLKGGRGPNDST